MREYRTTFLLPRPDLSAREAFTVLQTSGDSTVNKIFRENQLLEVGTTGTSTPEGRAEKYGGWCFRFRPNDSTEGAMIHVYSNGNVSAHPSSKAWPPETIGNSTPWVDSAEVALVASTAPSQEYDSKTSVFYRLTRVEKQLLWVVTRTSLDRERNIDKDHELVLSGEDARLLLEHIKYMHFEKVIRSQLKVRVGERWEDPSSGPMT